MLSQDEVLSICEDVSSVIVEKLKIKYSEYFPTIEYGKFYRFENIIFCYSEEPLSRYKFSTFEYLHENIDLFDTYIKKHKEYWLEIKDITIIEKYLLAEAERRGFKDGCKYISNNQIYTLGKFNNLSYFENYSDEGFFTDGCGGSIFQNSVWAKVV